MAVLRDSSVNLPGSRKRLQTYLGSGVVIYDDTFTFPIARHTRVIKVGTGQRPKPDDLTPSAYSLTANKKWCPVGIHQYRTGNSASATRQRYSGDLGPSDGPRSSIPWRNDRVTLENEAIIDALIKLKDQRFNAGVAIAEARGLADMLGDAANWMSDVRRAFNTKDFKKAYKLFREHARSGETFDAFKRKYSKSANRVHTLGKVPQSWLYYHFGVKPTVNDIDNAHKELFRDVANHPSLATTYVHGNSSMKQSGVVAGNWDVNLKGDLHYRQRESVRCRLSVKPKNEVLARMSSAGATNPPEALWNRLPGSWLVDYFFSVGDFLSILDAGFGYDFGDYVLSYRRTRDMVSKWDFATRSSYIPEIMTVSEWRAQEFLLDRKVVGNMYPPMYDVLPRVKLKDLGMTKVATMLSVLAGTFGKGPFRFSYA